MSEDGIYKRLESLLSDSDPVIPDPESAPPARPEVPVEPEQLAEVEPDGAARDEPAISER